MKFMLLATTGLMATVAVIDAKPTSTCSSIANCADVTCPPGKANGKNSVNSNVNSNDMAVPTCQLCLHGYYLDQGATVCSPCAAVPNCKTYKFNNMCGHGNNQLPNTRTCASCNKSFTLINNECVVIQQEPEPEVPPPGDNNIDIPDVPENVPPPAPDEQPDSPQTPDVPSIPQAPVVPEVNYCVEYASNGACHRCIEGYSPNFAGKCEACAPVPNCKAYEPNHGMKCAADGYRMCFECNEGFELVPSDDWWSFRCVMRL